MIEALSLITDHAQASNDVKLDALLAEDEQKKSKKAEKRRRQKIQKLAKKEGISVEEATKRLSQAADDANESSESEENDTPIAPSVVHVSVKQKQKWQAPVIVQPQSDTPVVSEEEQRELRIQKALEAERRAKEYHEMEALERQ